jgi:putative ABC transport system ATP-binding protein
MIVGRNGAGKSSLFKVLAGEVLPDRGEVIIRSLHPLPVVKVLQNPDQGTVGDFSLRENLSLSLGRGRGLKRYATKQQRDQVEAALASISLEGRGECLARTLSGGQRQALRLVMAMGTGAPILLLHEIPFALHGQMADFVMDRVLQVVCEEKKTVLAITHSMVHALRYGDRLLLMDQGRILRHYTQKEREGMTPMDLFLLLGMAP